MSLTSASNSLLLRGALAVAVCLPAGAAATAAGPAVDVAPAATRFELPDDSGQPVIRFTEHVGEVAGSDHPSITVYPDGRVVRHRAAFMKDPGDYVTTLPVAEVEELVASLAARGILTLDLADARQARDQAERASDTLFYASDPSLFRIAIHLDSFQPAGALAPQSDYAKTIAWAGLRTDARRFPEIAAIRNLSAAVEDLNELARRVEIEARAAQQ